MLKHANISRTSKAQQTLQLQRHCHNTTTTTTAAAHSNNQQSDCNNNSQHASLDRILAAVETGDLGLASELLAFSAEPASTTPPPPPPPAPVPQPGTCNAASLLQSLSPTAKLAQLSALAHQAPYSWNSLERPRKMLQGSKSHESIVKVFAQSLSQDVEYVSLKVSPQTRSQQIIKTLLKKFRLRHRDPNLFYLTLERWIRKDGLRYKSVMLLGDETCPLQLQQCCSNPPHDNIKFTLQMRTGALIKIFCFDIAPEARYKCLSLSTQTTVDETIELLLHCLNLFNTTDTTPLSLPPPTTVNSPAHPPRLTCSPGSIGSSSSASSTSSSSGMESDFPPSASMEDKNNNNLVNNSRASSVTSISSTSDNSTISSSIIELYCLVVECQNQSLSRTLNSDEYVVDVYQSLVTEARLAPKESSSNSNEATFNSSSDSVGSDEQWFSIKLKRRDLNETTVELPQPTIMKLRIPRQNIPLPPIPTLPSTLVNRSLHFNSASLMTNPPTVSRTSCIAPMPKEMHTTSSYDNEKEGDELGSRMPPPPQFILLPPIQPRRRRNLSNISSTFGRPLQNTNRRRYDPAQLAEDLIKLEVTRDSEVDLAEIPPPASLPTSSPPSTIITDKMLHNHLVSSFKSTTSNVQVVELETTTTTTN